MEKIAPWETRITELKAQIAAGQAAGASKRQLAHLRTELEKLHEARRTAILEAEIKANWVGPAVLEKLGR